MDFEEYAKEAMRTYPSYLSDEDKLELAEVGVLGEAGELLDLLKKEVFHGHHVHPEKYKKEIGDVFWYVATSPSPNGKLDEEYLGCESRSFRIKKVRDLIRGASSGLLRNRAILSLYAICAAFGYDPGEIMAMNIAKLRERYKVGFSTAESVAGVDVKENDL